MSEISLKDIAALVDSGKLSERDLAVLEAQLIKLERLKAVSYTHLTLPTKLEV